MAALLGCGCTAEHGADGAQGAEGGAEPGGGSAGAAGRASVDDPCEQCSGELV